MAVVQGQVNIQIKTDAAGNAAPKVKAVGDAVDKVGASANATRNPIAALGSGIMALKDGVSPIESIKGAVDSLAGTFAFAGGAIGLAAGAVSVLVDILSTAESETEKLIRTTEEASTKSHDHATALIEQGRAAVGTAANMRELKTAVYQAMAANAAMRGDTDAAANAARSAAGEAAAKAVEDQTEKIGALSTEQNKLGFVTRALTDEIDNQEAAFSELVKTYGHVTSTGDIVIDRSTELGRAAAGVIQKRADDIKKMKEQRAEQLLRIDGIDGEIAALKSLRAEKEQGASDAGIYVMEEMVITPRRRRGGGGKSRAQKQLDRLEMEGNAIVEQARLELEQMEMEAELAAELAAAEANSKARAVSAIHELARMDKALPYRAEAEGAKSYAAAISDFTTQLSASIPMMAAFSAAAGTIASSWDAVASANDNVMQVEARYREGKASEIELSEAAAAARKMEGKAALDSVGAIAKAGAEQIKNERLRAGVLAIIETGLSIASFAMYDYVGGAAHAAAALMLGSVAIFGGSKSSSGKAEQPRTQQAPSTAQQPTQSVTQVNVYGGWYGSQSPQENAWALEQQTRRHAGNGFARAA